MQRNIVTDLSYERSIIPVAPRYAPPIFVKTSSKGIGPSVVIIFVDLLALNEYHGIVSEN